VVVISKSGGHDGNGSGRTGPLKAEAARYYGFKSEMLRHAIVPITGPVGKLRNLCRSEGYSDDDILTIPDDVGGPLQCAHSGRGACSPPRSWASMCEPSSSAPPP